MNQYTGLFNLKGNITSKQGTDNINVVNDALRISWNCFSLYHSAISFLSFNISQNIVSHLDTELQALNMLELMVT